jgi:uncharacterized iron-regulated membrane protein
MAFFLMIIGLTGSIIVFNPELYDWFDPPPKVTPRATPMLDVYTLRERAQALVPHGMVNSLSLHFKAGNSYVAGIEPRVDPATGSPYDLGITNLALDPYTGAELKRDNYAGDIWPITQKNIMPLINRLHYQLAIPGSIGSYLFGIVALVWFIDCFISAYLTFPVSVRRRKEGEAAASATKQRNWLSRWWNPAWLVKWNSSAYRVNFDLHRAGGLWVWIMLLALAWSSVGFNLSEEVYNPVMKAVFGMPYEYGNSRPALDKPRPDPALSWQKAHDIAKSLMREQERLLSFHVEREDSLMYQPDKGVFLYVVRSDRDLWDEGALTVLLFDDHGKFISMSLPTGQNVGTTLNTWIFALHMAQIWGLPFRIFVTCMGILIIMFSVTGVYIWLKKRKARRWSRARNAPLAIETP